MPRSKTWNQKYYVMITLSQRLKRKSQSDEGTTSRASIRDRLLVKEAQEMSQLLPTCCSVHYNNENDLSKFTLTVRPTEGYWEGGIFLFEIFVTEEYNMVVTIGISTFFNKLFQSCHFLASNCKMYHKAMASKYYRIRRSVFIFAKKT